MAELCAEHRESIDIIHEVRTDVKWLIRIGTRWFTVIGAALALLFPILITFFVYLSKVEARLSVVEYQISQITKK